MSRKGRTNRLVMAVAAVAALGSLAACSSEPITKAGTAAHSEHTIVLQMPDGADPDGVYLARDIAKLSHGALKVTVDSKTYDSASPANEARLTADVRSGRVGFAYQPARDWAAAGVPGFQALMEPFAITTIAASQRVAASPVAATVLGQLAGYSAVGIGLVAGEPRQMLSVRPLFAKPQFAGAKIRIIDNPQTARMVSALGARPVQGLTSTQVNSPLHSGSVTAVETSPSYIAENAYQNAAPYLTSYALFPKFEALVASKKAWAALSPADQAAMKQAVADTRRNSGQLASRETLELTQLCQQGVVLDRPTAAQLGALAQSTATARPVSAAAADVERQIRALPGTGMQLNATGTPAGCRIAGDAATATAIHRLLTPVLTHHGGGRIPPGTYVVTDTVADWAAGGQYGDDWDKDVTFTWRLHADGRFSESQSPDFPDQGTYGGHYAVKGDEVTFTYETCSAGAAAASSGDCGSPETVRWSYFDGQLTFVPVDVADTASRVIYTAHPWRKAS